MCVFVCVCVCVCVCVFEGEAEVGSEAFPITVLEFGIVECCRLVDWFVVFIMLVHLPIVVSLLNIFTTRFMKCILY